LWFVVFHLGVHMKSLTIRMLCRMLIVSMFMLPIHGSWAGMVGTEQAMAVAGAQAERNAVLAALSRADVSSQLSALGVDPRDARARVAAMSDGEVRAMANRIDSLPAGAGSGWEWAAAIAIVAVVVWFLWK